MGEEQPSYKRLGHLVSEPYEQRDDKGELVARGTFAAEMYECSECHAIVWWGTMERHTDWHNALASTVNEIQ